MNEDKLKHLLDRLVEGQPDWGKRILGEYREYLENEVKNERTILWYLNSAKSLILFALDCNVTDLKGLSHKIFFDFYNQSKNVNYPPIRKFAKFISNKNGFKYLEYSCYNVSISKILNDGKLEFPQIIAQYSYNIDEYNKAVEIYKSYLIDNKYSKTVISAANIIDRIVKFMMECFSLNYSDEFIKELIKLMQKNIKSLAGNYTHFLYSVKDILEGNDIKKFYFVNKKLNDIPEWAKNAYDEFIVERSENYMSKSTLSFDKNAVYKLTSYLDSIGVKSYSDITQQHLINFHAQDIEHKTSAGKNAYNVRIAIFLKFLARKKYIEYKIAYAMPTGAAHKTSPAEILTDEQIGILLNYFKECDGNKLYYRNVAILKIGFFLGLRSSDIANLQFSNFDLKNRTLKIIQQKTQKELSLPLSDSIINSIFLYIEKERPKIKSQYIFITSKSPYIQMNKMAVRIALNHVFGKNVVNPHMLRKTFSSNLLTSGSNIDIITSFLGHSNDKTVYKYLDTDEVNMKKCPISLVNIEYAGTYL